MNGVVGNKVHYCYICAAARSGSTLLDLLLGGHSQVGSLGEFSFLGKALALNEPCGCGAPVCECGSWGAVLDRVKAERGIDLRLHPYGLRQWDARGVHLVDRAQQTPLYTLAAGLRAQWMLARAYLASHGRYGLPMPPSLQRGIDNTLYLYDVVRSAWDRQLVVDSSKNLMKALTLYHARPGQFRIVLLMRDGRGVFHSRRKLGLSARASLDAWRKYHERAGRLLARHVAPEHRLAVRYEELAERPEAVLREICTFLGLSFEPEMVDLALSPRHLINGNRGTRARRAGGVALDERWRAELDAGDLAYFDRRAGRLNSALGYGRGDRP